MTDQPHTQMAPPEYTQTPNMLYALMGDMNEAELKITMAVTRVTFGYHRRERDLTIPQLMALTKLSRASVVAGVTAAIERTPIPLVVRVQKGKSFTYRMNVAEPPAEWTAPTRASKAPVEPSVNSFLPPITPTTAAATISSDFRLMPQTSLHSEPVQNLDPSIIQTVNPADGLHFKPIFPADGLNFEPVQNMDGSDFRPIDGQIGLKSEPSSVQILDHIERNPLNKGVLKQNPRARSGDQDQQRRPPSHRQPPPTTDPRQEFWDDVRWDTLMRLGFDEDQAMKFIERQPLERYPVERLDRWGKWLPTKEAQDKRNYRSPVGFMIKTATAGGDAPQLLSEQPIRRQKRTLTEEEMRERLAQNPNMFGQQPPTVRR